MSIGKRIKEERMKAGMTQKEVAEQLHVSFQAVSRWENDEVEPSVATIRDLATLFHCTVDTLFDMNEPEPGEPETKPEPVVEKIVERVIVQDAPRVLAVCEDCKKAITDSADVDFFYDEEGDKKTLCVACKEKRKEQQRFDEQLKEETRLQSFAEKKSKGLIWGAVVAAIILVIGLCFLKDNQTVAICIMVAAIPAFTFTACLFFDNNLVLDVFVGVSQWSLHLPSLIFEWDFDGCMWFLAMKVLFAAIGACVSVAAFLFAVALSFTMSIIVFPIALHKICHGIDSDGFID